ncbi:unnamed protein product [Soboliphyme baturini]|uniref:EGF-like domain-containing protein n=1 Tax=Soboliphyme baturini TaxID=241478 RepID=A0A183J7Y9_9BILA|nr:unnamed protein product [Soboliphyme baturini]
MAATRVHAWLESECLNSTLNDCSPNAVCYDLSRGHRCECFPDYVDLSPDPEYPGRVCELRPTVSHFVDKSESFRLALLIRTWVPKESTHVNVIPATLTIRQTRFRSLAESAFLLKLPICLDSSRNDCHRLAICIERGNDEYECRCRDGYVDVSKDKDYPGRICREIVNECQNPSLNNCSRFADCTDLEVGYECHCREGYHDQSPSMPGRKCSLSINECESTNLNDCDRNAICTDLAAGYDCKCPSPYRDESPDPERPGRICRRKSYKTTLHQFQVYGYCLHT